MKTTVCVHFNCPRCSDNPQRICLDSRLREGECLVCSSGHNVPITSDETEKVNMPFKYQLDQVLDVYP